MPFTRKPERPDKGLEAKLKAEWPAILRWMIDGCLDWQQHGLVRPHSVAEATADYFAQQDILGQFLEEECDVEVGNPHKTAVVGEVFSAWSTYAKAAGEMPGSNRALTAALSRRGIERHRTKLARLYRGIRLNSPAMTDDR